MSIPPSHGVRMAVASADIQWKLWIELQGCDGFRAGAGGVQTQADKGHQFFIAERTFNALHGRRNVIIWLEPSMTLGLRQVRSTACRVGRERTQQQPRVISFIVQAESIPQNPQAVKFAHNRDFTF